MNAKLLLIIAVVAAALVAAAVVFTGKGTKTTTVVATKPKFLPNLAAEVNDIARIEIATSKDKMEVVRIDDKWTLPQSSNYPVKLDPVRNLLLDLANLKTLESKTANPELYPRLEVEDITKENAASRQVRLFDEKNEEKLALIVGKDEYKAGSGETTNKYVRKVGDPQAWLVEGGIRFTTVPSSWLEIELTNILPARARRIAILHKDGERVESLKEDQNALNYTLVTQPEGRELKSETITSEMSRMFGNLRFEDVKPRSELDLEGKEIATATLETYDGLRVVAHVFKVEEKEWVTFEATADESVIEAENQRRTDDAEKATKAAEVAAKAAANEDGKPASDTAPEVKPVEPELIKPEDIKKEVDDINAKFGSWAYIIPDYLNVRFTRRNEYFLKEVNAEDESAATGGEGYDQPASLLIPDSIPAPGELPSIVTPDADTSPVLVQ